MVDLLIINVRVQRTRRGYKTYTNECYYVWSADLLGNKLGDGLDKSKRTFESTTQENFVSSIIPITLLYSKELL